SLWTASSTAIYYNAGNVGIGTTGPAQKLSVAGTIESTTGGIKFPDGTTQTSAASGGSVLHVRDEKASGTAGGANISGVQTRTLNTVVLNEITGASLSSNQIILPSGTYEVFGSCPSHPYVLQVKCGLYNVTDSVYTLVGLSEYEHNANFIGKFTITAQKTFEVRHYMNTVKTGDGLGISSSSGMGNEVYTEVFIKKI
ncbi:MAG: hypothetical protein AAB516_00580, partial [Patescibacteria group bacterium]